jgi:DNA-binding CsgD family transcriptional regulator
MEMIGRDPEREGIERWLDSPERLLLIEGEAGIGKSTLWRAAVGEAERRDYRVLACTAARSETQLAFTSLRDLLGPVFDELADSLPPPQRRVLAVVLLRDESGALPPDPGAIAMASLTALRVLAAERPSLVAVDDAQWIDDASASPLAFAIRRLDSAGPAILLARRLDSPVRPLELESLPSQRIEAIQLGPMSVGALARMLREQLGATYPRPTLHKLYETSGGNPFYALELARALGRSTAQRRPGEALPVPGTLTALVEERLTALPRETRVALEVVSALTRPTLEIVSRALECDPSAALEPAVDEHVVELDADVVRFTHPVIAAAVYDLASRSTRSSMHRRLAAVVDDVEQRGRHLALGSNVPDRTVASAVEDAARRTHIRGARIACAELFDAAARLTPASDEVARARRTLAAAAAVYEAGATAHARALLEPLVTAAPDREQRAEAAWRLGLILADTSRYDEARRLWADAVRQSDDRSRIAELRRGMAVMAMYSGHTREASEHAAAAVAAAEASGDVEQQAYALSTRAWVGLLAGEPGYSALLARAVSLEARLDVPQSMWSPSTMVAECARFSLDLDGARATYPGLARAAAELGNVELEWWATFGLARTELLSGDFRAATLAVLDTVELAEALGRLELPTRTLRAELDGELGDSTSAIARLGEVSAEASRLGEVRWQRQALAGLGRVALAAGDAATAADAFADARRLASDAGMRHPALFLTLADEAEAAAEAGHVEQCEVALESANSLGSPPPWVETILLRARAAKVALEGELQEARDALGDALARSRSGVPAFQIARTLFALGRAERRSRHRRASREHLEQAAALFDETGAVAWAGLAHRELHRIGGRRPSSDGLTPAEQRVADLVAEGKSNKEVAVALVVSVHTVEAALTSIYRKLDVRSRTELAHKRLAESKD